MAFEDPMQWVIIGVVVLVIFLWGPQKIPELARSIGKAKKEFDSAKNEFNTAATAVTNPVGAAQSALLSSVVATAPKPAEVSTGDQTLVNVAQQLGISTEGKTREQISQEIVSRSKAPN